MSFQGPNAVRTFKKEPLELKDSFEIIFTERKNKLRENVWDAYHLEQTDQTDLFC